MRALGLVALLIGAASADGPKTAPPKPVAEAVAAFDAAYKAKLTEPLVRCLGELARSGAAEPDKRQQQLVRKKLKSCLKHKHVAVRVAALEGYGELALAGSSKDLRRFVDRRQAKRQPQVVVEAALDAWGQIHDPGSHEELIEFIKVPSESGVARAYAKHAAKALVAYDPKELNKRQRYALFEDVVRTIDAVYAAAHANIYPSATATRWWDTVNPSMIKALNAYTGLKLESYHDCMDWWKANKRDIKAGRG